MKLLFVGDFFYDYEYLANDLQELALWIHQEDYQVILNLEGGLYPSSKPIEKRGQHLYQSEFAIKMMKSLNVIGVCMANNHTMDYGADALQRTLDALDESEIGHTGAGMSLEDSLKPMILGNEGEQAVVINFGWDVEETIYASMDQAGCAPRRKALILANIQLLREKYPNASLIAVMHWGFELNPLPQPLDVKLAHDMVDAGVDLIIGHHPHNIQPFEVYHGTSIYYSLGNFYFSGHRSNFSRKSFHGDVENLCDYGAMVEWELGRGLASHAHMINYDRGENATSKISHDERILSDMTGADFFSPSYEEQASKCSLNVTPILTLDKEKNRKKLRRLFAAYRISKWIKCIRNVGIGERVYQWAKRLYKSSQMQ